MADARHVDGRSEGGCDVEDVVLDGVARLRVALDVADVGCRGKKTSGSAMSSNNV